MRPFPGPDGRAGAYALLASTALACAAPAPTPRVVEGAASEPPLSGRLLSRYRGRWSDGASDHDLYQTVDLEARDPAERWKAAVLARGAFDVDGRDGPGERTFDVRDTRSRFVPELFHAYLDLERGPLQLLRFGRQPLYETPLTVVFDGVRAELAPRGGRRAGAGLFAGIGEHLYESSSDGDPVFGLHGALAPWSGAELRADWMRLEDERLGVAHENDLFGLVLAQDVVAAERSTRLEARFSALERAGRDLRLSASHVDALGRWSLSASAYRLLQPQRSLAAPLDPFSDTLFDLFPYTQLGLSALRAFEHVELLAGADLRRVNEAGDEGEFNRDFERYYLTGTLPDALPVTLALTGEVWRAADDDFETWGALLSRELAGGFELALGSHYALYEYDLVAGEERDHVRSTAVDLRWKASASQRWSLRYEFENSDLPDFHRVELDYTWSF
jgi:hypothetical protein